MTLSRRRFITIAACATVLPGAAAARPFVSRRWTGQAMGAHASLVVNGLDKATFEDLSANVTAEIERLENIFSLYRRTSDLNRLNQAGELENPSLELVELLSLAGSIHRHTDGAFDPTVQPLWDLLARTQGKAEPQALAGLRGRIGWDKVACDSRRIRFAVPGMAMTLNGIAQGYVTDRVTDLLRRRGLRNVLVSMGEIAAIGHRVPGQAWRIGISETENGKPEEFVELKDLSIATSAPSGTVFDEAGAYGHILDPRSGKPTARWRRLSVINRTATVADGLSTAFCSMAPAEIRQALRQFPGSRLLALDSNGKRLELQS